MKDIVKTSKFLKLRCPMSIRRFLLMLLIVNGNVGWILVLAMWMRDCATWARGDQYGKGASSLPGGTKKHKFVEW
jgi:hypothetical protein